MKLHHTKHHQTYVTGLNAAEEAYVKTNDTKQRIALQAALKFNGGGHINHSLFWTNLTPASSTAANLDSAPKLSQVIKDTFGSFETFKKIFNAKTAAVQGSGWGWLGWNADIKKLEIVTTPNQDPLICMCNILRCNILR